MPLGELHKRVALVALRAAAGHGFARRLDPGLRAED
jgi:hypothetical protein